MSERRFAHEVVVPARVSEVWQAWTTPEGIRSFFAEQAWVELRRGGPFEMYFLHDRPPGQRGSEGCRIVSYVPERMLSFTWNAPPHLPEVRDQHTWVVLFFSPVDGGTKVELVHLGWGEGDQWDAAYHYFASAWPRVLDALAGHFGEPEPPPSIG